MSEAAARPAAGTRPVGAADGAPDRRPRGDHDGAIGERRRADADLTGTQAQPPTRWWHLDSLDRQALWLWLLSRVALLLVSQSGPFLLSNLDQTAHGLRAWERWDWFHFNDIALNGYFDPLWDTPTEAFFPGLPMVMRFGYQVFGIPTAATGMILSFVGGAIACIALCRLAKFEFGEPAAIPAVVAFVAVPTAVFMSAPYTEAPFLMFALPAWLLARKDKWAWACILATCAAAFRISALFLVAAMGLQFLVSRDWHRIRTWWPKLFLFLLPVLPVAGYFAWLHHKTGDWLRWQHAQSAEWYREFTWPWEALATTWRAGHGAVSLGQGTPIGLLEAYAWMFRAELVAMVIGVIVTVLLLLYRRWGEAAWMGLPVAALATSHWFFSVPRSALLWWPMFLLIGWAAAKRRWVLWVYLALSVPLAGVWATSFLISRWSG